MKKQQPPGPAVKAMQIRELQKRLADVLGRGYRRTLAKREELKPPKEVIAARKVLDAFDRKNSRAYDAAWARAEQKAQDARAQILFGDIRQALKMIEAMEKEMLK